MTENPHPLTPEESGADSAALDTVLQLLDDHCRRRVITALVDETPRTVD
ncbi:MAG: hypothetical protein ABEJ89_07820 [Haloarculaceae archaeon]